MARAVLITGTLSEADVAELLATLRTIEQRDPTRVYRAMAVIVHEEPRMAEMLGLLDRIFPPVPGRPFDVLVRRRDEQ